MLNPRGHLRQGDTPDMSREAPVQPDWLRPDRLVPDLLAGVWALLVVMLYADGPLRYAFDYLSGLLGR